MEADNENIPLLDRDEYDQIRDDWNEDETSFISNQDQEETSHYETPIGINTRVLGNRITRQKIDQIYNILEINGDVGVNIDRFRTRYNNKTGVIILEFDKTGRGNWDNITDKRTGKPLAINTIKNKFGGVEAMKNFWGLDSTPIVLERSFNEAKKLNDKIPTEIEMHSMSNEKLLDSITKIQHATRDISSNTDLDMREMLGIDKALQRMSGELQNNLGKLTEIDKHINKEHRKLKEVENDQYITDEQRQEIHERISKLKEERDARLELVSQNRKDLSSQFARIRQTVEKILDGDLTLREKIKMVFREHGLTIMAILTAFGLIIESIVTSVIGGSSGGKPPPKDEKGVRKWFQDKLKALARLFGKLASKAASALPGIIGSIISGILNFMKKAVGFLAEHTWALIVGIVGFIGYALLYRKR